MLKMVKPAYNLEELEALRLDLEKERAEVAARMRLTATELFAPMPAGGKVQSLLNNAERAIAVYDGVRLGFKLFRQVRRLFKG